MKFIEILEERRKIQKAGKKMSIAKFAKLLNVNASTYFRWLNEDVPMCSRGGINRAFGIMYKDGNPRFGDTVYLLDAENDTWGRFSPDEALKRLTATH